jgi:hypothetical protein
MWIHQKETAPVGYCVRRPYMTWVGETDKTAGEHRHLGSQFANPVFTFTASFSGELGWTNAARHEPTRS